MYQDILTWPSIGLAFTGATLFVAILFAPEILYFYYCVLSRKGKPKKSVYATEKDGECPL